MMLLNQRFQPWKSRHNYQHTDQAAAPSVILSDSDISDISNLQEWPIKYILRETATEYLIDWEGPYDPTWVSRRFLLSSCTAQILSLLHVELWLTLLRLPRI